MMTGDIDVWARPPNVPINQPSRTPRSKESFSLGDYLFEDYRLPS